MNRAYKLIAAAGAALLSQISAVAADEAALNCLRSRLLVENPVMIQAGPDQAMIKMKITNNLSWPVRDLYLDYVITTKKTGAVVSRKPVSLTIPEGLAPGEAKTVQSAMFGFDYMPEGVVGPDSFSADKWRYHEIPASKAQATVRIADVADPNGDQVVRAREIVGLGWTGKKSELGCN